MFVFNSLVILIIRATKQLCFLENSKTHRSGLCVDTKNTWCLSRRWHFPILLLQRIWGGCTIRTLLAISTNALCASALPNTYHALDQGFSPSTVCYERFGLQQELTIEIWYLLFLTDAPTSPLSLQPFISHINSTLWLTCHHANLHSHTYTTSFAFIFIFA